MIRHHQHRYRRRAGWFADLGRELAGWCLLFGLIWFAIWLFSWALG